METIHIFEQAGLGKAPYEYLYCVDSKASCQFCNTNIRYKFFLKSADNKIFFVGSDCISKSGDRGLMKFAKAERIRIAREQRQAKRQKQYEERQAKRQQLLQDKIENFYKEYESIKHVFDWANNTKGLANQIIANLATWGSLTEKQCNLLCDLYKDAHKQKANCPEGKCTIRGTVQSLKQTDGYYGIVNKMTILTQEGFKVYGTVPGNLEGLCKGDCVQFDATITPSKDDPAFGFYSRPSKGIYFGAG